MRLFITMMIIRSCLFPSVRIYRPPTVSPIVRFAKILPVLNGFEKCWPVTNIYLHIFFISNDLIVLDHCQILGNKIPDII